jgi:hypothetical protein
MLAPKQYVDRHGNFVEDAALDASEDEIAMLPDIERMLKRAALE